MTSYRLVPLDGDTGMQEVDGKRAALEIAREIANREHAGVHMYPVGGEGRTLVEPDPRAAWGAISYVLDGLDDLTDADCRAVDVLGAYFAQKEEAA